MKLSLCVRVCVCVCENNCFIIWCIHFRPTISLRSHYLALCTCNSQTTTPVSSVETDKKYMLVYAWFVHIFMRPNKLSQLRRTRITLNLKSQVSFFFLFITFLLSFFLSMPNFPPPSLSLFKAILNITRLFFSLRSRSLYFEIFFW